MGRTLVPLIVSISQQTLVTSHQVLVALNFGLKQKQVSDFVDRRANLDRIKKYWWEIDGFRSVSGIGSQVRSNASVTWALLKEAEVSLSYKL